MRTIRPSPCASSLSFLQTHSIRDFRQLNDASRTHHKARRRLAARAPPRKGRAEPGASGASPRSGGTGASVPVAPARSVFWDDGELGEGRLGLSSVELRIRNGVGSVVLGAEEDEIIVVAGPRECKVRLCLLGWVDLDHIGSVPLDTPGPWLPSTLVKPRITPLRLLPVVVSTRLRTVSVAHLQSALWQFGSYAEVSVRAVQSSRPVRRKLCCPEVVTP